MHRSICLFTYKTLTNQQPTYLYNSLSFPSHSVSTRSPDSLVLPFLYVRSSLGKVALSVIGPQLWNSLPPDTRNSSSLPIFRSRLKMHLFKIACLSLGSFPSPLRLSTRIVDSWYPHFMPYRMTPSVRHRAIKVHYYYYYFVKNSKGVSEQKFRDQAVVTMLKFPSITRTQHRQLINICASWELTNDLKHVAMNL